MATTPPNYGPFPGPQPTVPPPPAPPVYGPPSPAPTVTTPSGTTDPGMLGDWYAQYKGPGAISTYTPTTAGTTNWNVDKNQTVQGQVADITKADGVLMQQASTRAAQQSSGRGLLNSSLGVQAGQAALYDAAMPMATADAATFADAAKTNAGETNLNSRFNASEKNKAGEFNAGAANDLNLGMFNNATDIYRDRARDEFTAGQNTLDREFQNASREDTQTFTAGQNEADRTFQTGEREAGQKFTAGENTLNRDFENANREDTQAFNKSENAAQRSWQTGERVAGQTFTAGETALNRAWQSGERINAQNFTAAQATLDRDQQSKIQQLQEQGMTARQATDIASRERMQIAQQTFDSETLAKEQEFMVARDATAFENQLAIMDQSAGTNLAASYRASAGSALTAYQSGVTAIQQSDMDEDVKTAQIAALGTIYQTSMQFTNTLFENSPGWSEEWSTVSPEFATEGG